MPGLDIAIGLEIQGADRLGRYSAEELEDRFLALLAAGMAEVAEPAMRQVAPYRTGRLRRSVYSDREEGAVVIGVSPAGWYWHLQPGLSEEWARILRSTLAQLVPAIAQAVTLEALSGWLPDYEELLPRQPRHLPPLRW